MKLKVDKCFNWLEVDKYGVAYFHEEKPRHLGMQYDSRAEVLSDLEPGALYKRNGEEWEKVK